METLNQPPMQPHRSNNTLALLLTGIIVGVLTVLTIALISSSKLNQQNIAQISTAPKPTIEPTANWKTYESNLGFSIRYPQHWGQPIYPCHTYEAVCFSVRGYSMANYKAKPNKVGGAISIYRDEGNLNTFCQNKGFPLGSIVSCEQSSLNGLKALKKVQILDDGFSNDENRSFYIVHGKYFYVLSGTFVRTDTLTEKEIDQILSTFRFLDGMNNAQKACMDAGGKWLQAYNECEGGLNQNSCEQLGGNFEECASACRHDPKAELCIAVCIKVCKFN